MALALRPALLIADEPTTALDVLTQAQILRLILELRGKSANASAGGQAVLFVTHDFGVVADIADRVAVMQAGRVVEIGPAQQILRAPQHAYTRTLIAAVLGLSPRPKRATAAEAGLSIEALNVAFGPVRAVDDVSLRIPKGGTLAVVGESGSGKTTLARAAIRLVATQGGRILLGGEDFAALRGRPLRRRRRLVQMIFQDPYGSLNPRRTVGAILARAGRLGGLDGARANQRAADLIGRVGLPVAALHRRPAAFSGGQRQRIGIARALAMNPELVIADESVSALDVSVQAQVLALLAELQSQQGLTLLFITHDLRVAARIADIILVMRAGRVVECRPAAELLTEPRDAYTKQLLAAAPGRAWQAETEVYGGK
jgi:peptide/nickel transport system ATP-binding protein